MGLTVAGLIVGAAATPDEKAESAASAASDETLICMRDDPFRLQAMGTPSEG